MTETADHQFFQKVLPECNVPPASSCCAFSDVNVLDHRADVELRRQWPQGVLNKVLEAGGRTPPLLMTALTDMGRRACCCVR